MLNKPHVLFTAMAGFVLCMVGGCNKQDLPAPDTAAPEVKSVGPPATEEEARQFGMVVEKSLRARDAAKLEEILRTKDLVNRLGDDLGLSETERLKLARGAERSQQQDSLGIQIIQKTENGGSLKMLRVHSVNDKKRVLFRILKADGAVDYFDFVVVRHSDGLIGMEDVYMYQSGEMFTQTIRRLLIPIIAQTRDRKNLMRADEDYLKSVPLIKEMVSALKKGQFADAIKNFEELPRSVQDNKTILMYYVLANAQIVEAGDAAYLRAMERFRGLYPNDSSAYFVSIDYYRLRGEYDNALKTIDRIDKEIGGDPYLEVWRGNILMEATRYDEARQRFEAAWNAEPTLGIACSLRTKLALVEKNHVDTLKWLKKTAEIYSDDDLGDLEGSQKYADFVKSPQYREWQEWYRAHQKK